MAPTIKPAAEIRAAGPREKEDIETSLAFLLDATRQLIEATRGQGDVKQATAYAERAVKDSRAHLEARGFYA